MASILDLPTEVVWMILQNLDNVKDLKSAIRTCRWLHQSFLGNTHLAHEVLMAQVTSVVLPYLLLFNKMLGGPCGETFGNVVDFLDDQDGKTKELLAGYRDLPFRTLLRLGRYHDMISTMAYRYAAEAWSLLGQESALSLSKLDRFRLHCAFYRLELYLHPLREDTEVLWEFNFETWCRWVDVFRTYSVLENEQNASVYEFLEKRLGEESADYLAHDVYCGAWRVRGPPNPEEWFDQDISSVWPSYGFRFLRQLEEAKTWDDKASLLRDLAEDLLPHPIDYEIGNHHWAYGSQTCLRDYDDDMLDALLPEHRKQGPEQGLFELWRLFHQDVTQQDFINGHCFYRIRQRAYVFWDTERVEQYQLKLEFERVSGGYDDGEPLKYYDRKEKDSHEARERIWEAGGYGYWSEGDTSQVKWRDPVVNQRILPEKFNPEWFMEEGIVQWMERHLPDEA